MKKEKLNKEKQKRKVKDVKKQGKKDDIIDNSVGIVLNKKVGNLVKKDEVIARIYANDSEKLKEAIAKFDEVYEVSKNKIDSKIILDIITDYWLLITIDLDKSGIEKRCLLLYNNVW